jgi:hypothetical protein
MTSQLNVDTIVDKAGSGGTNVKIGNTSTYVSDGGGVTQNTVQGIAKLWISDETLVATSNHTEDSFNVGSITDVGTGVAQVNNTNNMSNTGYSCHTQHTINGDVMDTPKTVANTASERTNFFRSSTSAVTDQAFVMTIFGDLA